MGAPQAIAPEIRYFYSSGWAGFAASPSGSLIYLTEADSSRFYQYSQRRAGPWTALGSAAAYLGFSLAADGKSLLADRMQPKFGTYDIWQLDVAARHRKPAHLEPVGGVFSLPAARWPDHDLFGGPLGHSEHGAPAAARRRGGDAAAESSVSRKSATSPPPATWRPSSSAGSRAAVSTAS